jgi:hypothetical protein
MRGNDLKADQFLLPLDEWNALEKPQDALFQEWLMAWAVKEESWPIPWTTVASMMRTFMADVPQQPQPTSGGRRSWLACLELRI